MLAGHYIALLTKKKDTNSVHQQMLKTLNLSQEYR